MATLHFNPYKAVRYIGKATKVLETSIARPKPVIKKGDILIVDKKTAHNFVKRGFGQFEDVENITLDKDIKYKKEIEKLKQELETLKSKEV